MRPDMFRPLVRLHQRTEFYKTLDLQYINDIKELKKTYIKMRVMSLIAGSHSIRSNSSRIVAVVAVVVVAVVVIAVAAAAVVVVVVC